MVTIMIRILFLGLALLSFSTVARAEQSDCAARCAEIADRLKYMEGELERARAQERALRDQIATLERRGERAELDRARRDLDVAVGDVNRMVISVTQLASALRECQRQCRRREDRPHRPGDLVDESIPRAACPACQPLVDTIKELQRRRRIERDLLNEARARLDRHGKAPDGVDMESWFGEGMKLVMEESDLSRAVNELSDQIKQALIDLTACNARCVGTPPAQDRRTSVKLPDPAPNVVSQPVAKPQHRQVQTPCPQCLDHARRVNQAYDGLNYLWDRKLAMEKSLALVERITNERAAEIAKLESAVPPSGRSAQQQESIDSLKTINDQQRSGMARQQRELAEIEQQISAQQTLIAERMRQLAECEQRCKTPPVDSPLVAPSGPTPEVSVPERGVPRISVNCPGCRRYADLILDLMEERAELLEDMALAESVLHALTAGQPRGAELSPLVRPKRERILDDLDDMAAEIEQIDLELMTTWRLLTHCILACNMVPKTFWQRPWFFSSLGGLLIGTVISTTGGDAPVASPQPPVSTPPPPVSTPPPVTTPPATPPPTSTTPPATPSADGNYACVACNPSSDPARHDPFITLCRLLVGLLSVREGSITISHPAPFVSITGDYNTTTGAFTATGRGTVAGFPNVGVRGEGTVNTTTGRITMTYTMGTGGELPGGQPISYALTLHKQ